LYLRDDPAGFLPGFSWLSTIVGISSVRMYVRGGPGLCGVEVKPRVEAEQAEEELTEAISSTVSFTSY
jgi:hypothetical protein